MKQKNVSEEFQKEWEAFLSKRAHKVDFPKGATCVLQSRNAGGKKYRWVLLMAEGKSKRLNRAELEDVKCHLKRARSLKQKVYVAVMFRKPERKVIIIPADRVLKKKRILATKGGISWSD